MTRYRLPMMVTGGLLIALGLALGFFSSNGQSDLTHDETLDKVGDIEELHDLVLLTEAKPAATPPASEFDRTRASIDWSDAPEPAPQRVDGKEYELYINVTGDYLEYVFNKLGYTAEMIDSGDTTAIPPLFMISIPEGWEKDRSVQFKKGMFFRAMLPLVLYENEAVLAEREVLLDLQAAMRNGEPFSAAERDWLRDSAEKYLVIKAEDTAPVGAGEIEELLLRADMVSPSMALGQAAYESGYATSRFAHQANALFGQWDWSNDRIRPVQQRSGMGDYGIKAFEYPIDSVRAYIWNLNTHYRYEDFRKMRAQLRGDRTNRIDLDGQKLATTMLAYSERGEAYIKDLQGMMSFNRLERVDRLRLLEGEPVYFD